MENNETNCSVLNLIYICIDRYGDSDIEGRLYWGAKPGPLLFLTGVQMLLEIEKQCDRQGYPQAEVVTRRFKKKAYGQGARREEPQDTGSDAAADNNGKTEGKDFMKGKEGTFVVNIKYRQNATWQGSVTWAEKKQTCNFRSALELMQLIDCALDEEEEMKDEGQAEA